ncbi:MAG: enoyl-ACP reductase [Candidatus Tectomicrobia bacterium]|nr:enoyl-ACP reductase [Candidatus Tectomicrobia bacterium]
MGMFDGKQGVVFGIANKYSIAWAITKRLLDEGARIVAGVLSEREGRKLEALLEPGRQLSARCCDLTSDAQIAEFFAAAGAELGGTLHFLVHSVAFARGEDLQGDFVNTSRDGYLLAQNISAYTLLGVARAAAPLMTAGGSIITLTYIGGERVVPNYNVMGVAKAALEANVRYLAWNLGPRNIRVNAISAGPVKTLSARGVKGFDTMHKQISERAPLGRSASPEELASTAAFLLSDASSAITGEVLHVDGGYHIMGV